MRSFRERVQRARRAQKRRIVRRIEELVIKGLAVLGGAVLIGIGCGSTYPW